MCKIDTITIFFDFATNNGYLLETMRIMVGRIDLGLKSGNGINTNILAQMKNQIIAKMMILTTLPKRPNARSILFEKCLFMFIKSF